jgi:hypothetical protein
LGFVFFSLLLKSFFVFLLGMAVVSGVDLMLVASLPLADHSFAQPMVAAVGAQSMDATNRLSLLQSTASSMEAGKSVAILAAKRLPVGEPSIALR